MFLANKRLFLLIVVMSVLLASGCGSEEFKAQFVKVSGTVEMRTAPSGKFILAAQKDFLPAGGAVRTMVESSADLILPGDRGVIEIKADAYFELPTSGHDIKQDSGTIIYRVNSTSDAYTIDTPHGVTGVLGTTFQVVVDADSVTVGVKEGKVSLTNKKGEVRTIEANEKLSLNASGIFGEKTAFNLVTDGFKYIRKNEKWVPSGPESDQ